MTRARRFAFALAAGCAAATGTRSETSRIRRRRTRRLYRIRTSLLAPFPMALLLKESEVEKLLTMKRTLELVERVHREYSTGQAIDVPRERTRLPRSALQILQGAVPSASVRKLERVKVYSRTAEKVAKFCEKMRARLSLDVVPAASPEDAVRGSDIIVTITTSASPVFNGEWVAPGTHINAAGSNSLLRREIDEETVRKSAVVVVDSRPSALKEAGDLLPALEKGRLHIGALTELGEVIAGTRPGRTSVEQVTLFESQGMAMQDLVIAADLAKLARAQGVGQEVDIGS